MNHRIAGVRAEAVAPLVEGVAEVAPRPLNRLDHLGDRMKAKVIRTKGDFGPSGSLGMPHGSAVVRGGAVDPVIQPPLEIVHDVFGLVRAEAREHGPSDICNAIARRVLQVHDVRCRGDKDPPVKASDPARPMQTVREHPSGLEDTVSVFIVQQPDPT